MCRQKYSIKIIFILLIFSIMLIGCNNKYDNNNTISNENPELEEVNLKVILIGNKPQDCDLVFEEVNKITKNLINATIEPIFYDWDEWKNKYSLAFSSGEEYDLIYTSDWALYNQLANRNEFLELTEDLLKTYAPKSFEAVSEEEWEQAEVNGNVYMIPYTHPEYGRTNVAIIRGDLRKKYGLPEVTDLDGLINYMETVAKNEIDIWGYDGGGTDRVRMIKNMIFETPNYYSTLSVSGYHIPLAVDHAAIEREGKVVLVDLFKDKKYLEWLNTAKTLKENGVWKKNILANKRNNDTSFDYGHSAVYLRTPTPTGISYVKNNLAHPEWQLEVVDLYPDITLYVSKAINNGVAINRATRHPERALMMIDLLRHNKEINDLTTLGIEGVHWQAEGDKQYKSLPASNRFPVDGACPWGWRTNLYRVCSDYPQEIKDMLERIEKNGRLSKGTLFIFNEEPVKEEITSVISVLSAYNDILDCGFADNIEETLKEYEEQLMLAGYGKIKEEFYRQAEAFSKQYENK